MSTSTASRTPAELPLRPTLADLLDRLGADETLTPKRRQDVASALRTFARAMGCRLEELPAHPGLLRQRLKGFTPAMAGLAPRRWRNTLSLTRFALKQAGLAQVPGRAHQLLTPDWAALYGKLDRRRTRCGLSRLIHYCSARGIAPGQVDDALMAGFRHDLETAGLRPGPASV